MKKTTTKSASKSTGPIKKAVRKVVAKITGKKPDPVVSVRYSTNDSAWAVIDPSSPDSIIRLLRTDKPSYIENPVFSSARIVTRAGSFSCGGSIHGLAGISTGILHEGVKPKALRKTTDFVNFRFDGQNGLFFDPSNKEIKTAKWIELGASRFATVKL
jgi:hypothetical protein